MSSSRRVPPLVFGGRSRLFIDVQHGLANRMRAMASAASIAKRTGRELVVVWRADHHCECSMSELFDYDGAVIDSAVAELCRKQSQRRFNYMEIEAGARYGQPIILDDPVDPAPDVYVRSAYTLNSPHRFVEDEQAFLLSLRPAAAVRELVASVPHPNRVAAHVRSAGGPAVEQVSFEASHNWPAHRHAELTAWRKLSQAERFIARIDALRDQGQADTIFLASDQPEVYRQFARRYGSDLRQLKRTLFDRSSRQLQYALADMLLLTAADFFLASTWSSFSDMVQRLARHGRRFERSGIDF